MAGQDVRHLQSILVLCIMVFFTDCVTLCVCECVIFFFSVDYTLFLAIVLCVYQECVHTCIFILTFCTWVVLVLACVCEFLQVKCGQRSCGFHGQ